MKTRTRSAFVVGAALAFTAACGTANQDSTEDTAADTEGATTEAEGATTEAEGSTATGDAAADGEESATPGGDGVVTILGPETGSEGVAFEAAFEPFTERTGIEIAYSSNRDATTELNLALQGGTPPDLAVVPQPGRTKEFGAKGEAVPIPEDILASIKDNYNPFWFDLVTVDGEVYGVPNKADVKSLVWYNPEVFETNGYEIPETWDELEALSEQMKADGIAPWCVGIGSGDATGWPFTDWMEDIMLRLHGPEVYDQWVNHEIPFNDPKVKEAAQFVADIWFEEGNVYGGRDIIAQTGFATAGLPVIEGKCGMHRQANFYASQFVEAGGVIGETVDVFYLPTINDEFGQVVLGAGTHIVPFSDREEVMQVVEYIGSPEFANTRIKVDAGGFLSPNTAHDTSLYSADLDRDLAEILVNADPFRFDASDLMPGEVGAGAWWANGTDFVSGSMDIDTFLDETEAAWPAG